MADNDEQKNTQAADPAGQAQATPAAENQPKDTKADSKKPKQKTVVWLVNVKYRKARYKAGEKTKVNEDDVEDLLAAKVAKLVS